MTSFNEVGMDSLTSLQGVALRTGLQSRNKKLGDHHTSFTIESIYYTEICIIANALRKLNPITLHDFEKGLMGRI